MRIVGATAFWMVQTVGGYGALYNWHAVKTGKLAPKGWHVPTDRSGQNWRYF